MAAALAADSVAPAARVALVVLAPRVDSALAQWARFNSGTYPTDLTRLIDVGILPEKTPVEKFTYETAAANTTYRLVVTLAKGGEYTSPGSKY